MKRFLLILLLVLLLLIASLVGAVFLAFDDELKVNRTTELSAANVERAKRILDKNDPRKLKSGEQRTIVVTQQDLDLAANYLAHRYAGGGATVNLGERTMHISLSAEVPHNPLGRYANVEVSLVEDDSLLRLDRLQMGRLRVPAFAANWLLGRAYEAVRKNGDLPATTDLIKSVRLTSGTLAVSYQWEESLPDRLRSMLVTKEDQERIRAYHMQLVETSRSLAPGHVSLVRLMVPLFALSGKRSERGDAVAENRAALLVLAAYVNGRGLGRIIPSAQGWPSPVMHKATLNGREDFAKHFIVSAALAAHSGSPLSDAVGLYKELRDARGGSGFSFNDICADRAGTLFGERSAENSASAAKLQQRMHDGVKESDVIPSTKDLPEFMPEPEFRRRFGGVGEPKYNAMMEEIERRIAALPLHR